jgi:hypothetical protein
MTTASQPNRSSSKCRTSTNHHIRRLPCRPQTKRRPQRHSAATVANHSWTKWPASATSMRSAKTWAAQLWPTQPTTLITVRHQRPHAHQSRILHRRCITPHLRQSSTTAEMMGYTIICLSVSVWPHLIHGPSQHAAAMTSNRSLRMRHRCVSDQYRALPTRGYHSLTKWTALTPT